MFFAKNIYYIGVFKRNDERTIYNVLYRDGRTGPLMMKRCAIKGITRDREYDITKGTPKSEILYMSVNPNGEAEVLKIYFKPRPRLKKLIVDLNFGELAIKGRQSQGNLFSRYAIHKIVLKERGASTLAGQNVWYDDEIRRLNTDGRGELLGEFVGDDRLIVMNARGQYYTTLYDLGLHFPEDTIRVAKYDPQRIYSVAYYDGEQQYYYIKRFTAEQSDKMQNFVDETPGTVMKAISRDRYPQLEVTYGGPHAGRPAERIDVDAFIGVKSHRARGKRITTLTVDRVAFVEPLDKGPEEPGDGRNDSDVDEMPGGGAPVSSGSGDDSGMRNVPGGVSDVSATAVDEARRAGSAAQGNGRPQETAAASVSQRPPKPVQPAKGYVAGESVEFDIAAEDEEQGGQSQMELF